MSYFDSYKKRLEQSGGDVKQNRENQAINTANRNFNISQGYKQGHVLKPNEYIEKEIDFLAKSTSGELQKYFIFRPSSHIEIGSYVQYDGKIYIVRDFEEDLITPTALGFHCRHTINFEDGVGVPCWANNSTYGSKGITDMEKFLLLDAKLKMYIQRNQYTDTLRIGQRVMLANRYVYKITELDNIVYGDGFYVLVATRDELMPMDNFDKNVAWNEYQGDNSTEVANEIIGEDKLRVGEVLSYSTNGEAEWSIDDESYATIVSSSPTTVDVKGLKKGWIELIATVGDKIIIKEVLVC